jgi:RecA-family ATPase
MPSVKWNKALAGLPPRTWDYLEYGAEEGQRNHELYAAAQQMKARGDDINSSGLMLLERAMEDGLSESEARTTIESAWRSKISEPISRSGSFKPLSQILPKQKAVEATVEALPVGISAVGLPDCIQSGDVEFLKAVFREGELISIGRGRIDDNGEKAGIDCGEVRTREEWLAYCAENGAAMINPGKGTFIRVNPMKTRDGKSDDDIADFRHCLLESDSESKEQQYGLYLKSGLPLAAITDSGGDSIHAWVKIEASSKEEYDKRVATVYALFRNYKFDSKNGNPSRYARLPGADRPEGWQKLLATHVGAVSWVEFEKTLKTEEVEINEEFENSPQIISLEDCLKEFIPEPPKLIHGVLYRGGKLVFGGPPKIGKTWVLMALATAVANGGAWFGKKCDEGRVLYLNFELSPFTNQRRWRRMLEAQGVGAGNIDLRQMKGNAADISVIVNQVIYLARKNCVHYDLIILDPIYKAYDGRDENSAGEMAQVLNELDRLIKELDTSVAFAAHFPKGNLSNRNAMDRISGSGVFARDPEAIVTMTPWEKQVADDVRCDVDWTVRDFPDVAPIVVRKQFPLYEVDDFAPDRSGSNKVETILIFLNKTELTSGEWEKMALENGNISSGTFDDLLREARTQELIEKIGGQKGKWRLTNKGLVLLKPQG